MTLSVPCSKLQEEILQLLQELLSGGMGNAWGVVFSSKLYIYIAMFQFLSSVMTRGHHSELLLGRLRISGLSVEAIPLEGKRHEVPCCVMHVYGI